MSQRIDPGPCGYQKQRRLPAPVAQLAHAPKQADVFWGKEMDIIKLINNKKHRGIFQKDAALFDVDSIATSAEIATKRALDNKNVSDPTFYELFLFYVEFLHVCC